MLLFPLLTAVVWRLRGWKLGGWGKPLLVYYPLYLVYALITKSLFHWWWLTAPLILDILENCMNQDANEDDSFWGYNWSFFVGVTYGIIPLLVFHVKHFPLCFISGLLGGLGLLLWRLSQDYKWFEKWYRDSYGFFEPNGWGELIAGSLLGLGMILGLLI